MTVESCGAGELGALESTELILLAPLLVSKGDWERPGECSVRRVPTVQAQGRDLESLAPT